MKFKKKESGFGGENRGLQTKNPEKKQALFLESPVKKQKNGTNKEFFVYKEKEEEEGPVEDVSGHVLERETVREEGVKGFKYTSASTHTHTVVNRT